MTAVVGLGTLVAIGNRPVVAAGAEQDVPQADHAFM
jgi:hypothetical protein